MDEKNNSREVFFEKMMMLAHDKYSHWRIGQLYSNFCDWLKYEKCLDIFYVEDKELADLIKEYSKEGNI